MQAIISEDTAHTSDMLQLQAQIVESQNLNSILAENLQEWKLTNEQIERNIIEQQNLNVNLVENFTEWQLANQQLETQIINLQVTNQDISNQTEYLVKLQQLEQQINDLNFKVQTLTTEKSELLSLNEISENIVRSQKELILKQEVSSDDITAKYEGLLKLKQELIQKLEQELSNKVDQQILFQDSLKFRDAMRSNIPTIICGVCKCLKSINDIMDIKYDKQHDLFNILSEEQL